MTTVLALARADISPWQVLWWLLCAALVVAGTVHVVRYTVKWWHGQGDAAEGVTTQAVALIGVGCLLLVWGEVAGWATLL